MSSSSKERAQDTLSEKAKKITVQYMFIVVHNNKNGLIAYIIT